MRDASICLPGLVSFPSGSAWDPGPITQGIRACRLAAPSPALCHLRTSLLRTQASFYQLKMPSLIAWPSTPPPSSTRLKRKKSCCHLPRPRILATRLGDAIPELWRFSRPSRPGRLRPTMEIWKFSISFLGCQKPFHDGTWPFWAVIQALCKRTFRIINVVKNSLCADTRLNHSHVKFWREKV